MKQILNPADFSKIKRMNMKQLNDYILSIYLSGKEDMRNEILGDYDETIVIDYEDARGLYESSKDSDDFMHKIDILFGRE